MVWKLTDPLVVLELVLLVFEAEALQLRKQGSSVYSGI